MSEDRLTRMEDKLDKLSEAVLAIARMEERMLTVFKRLENVDGGIKKWMTASMRSKNRPSPEVRRSHLQNGYSG